MKPQLYRTIIIADKSEGTDITVLEGTSLLQSITWHIGSHSNSDFPAFTPAEAGTQFSNHGGMQG